MRLRAALLATVMLAAGASAVVLPATQRPASESLPTPHAHGPGHHGHSSQEHGHAEPASDSHAHDASAPQDEDFSWSSPDGRVPDPSDAGLRRLSNLVARTDRGLAELAAQGYVQGQGTRSEPYVIEGLRVARDLSLSDTGAYVIVRNNAILGQLTLNWNGQRLHVHHNGVRDLRINENVEREGEVTGGLVERNAIGFVGQMRHFSGEFRENRVGPKPGGPFAAALGDAGPALVPGDVVWNFDGFHGARVHHNVVEGLVDIKLHGHHHGSSYGAGPHEHARDEGHAHGVSHQERWHALSFTNNTISVAKGTALRYRDTPHAGDDRTAASETNPELELPHVHHTRVDLSENRLEGGGLVVRVFGSDDDRHKGPGDGLLRIARNRIVLGGPDGPAGLLGRAGGVGLDLHDAQGIALLLEGNEVRFEPGGALARGKAQGTGILLRGWRGADLTIADNAVHGAATGLRARDFDDATRWWMRGNDFEAPTKVDYDRSVANEPG